MRKISCGLATSVMSAIAPAGAPGEPQLPVFVVIQDHAGVPRHVLARAIQTVKDAYRPLGHRHRLDSSALSGTRHSDAVPESAAADDR